MTTETELHELFAGAMSSLASGVAVITTRRPDGEPCGLAATSVASYSAHPPSVLASIAHSSRCHEALAACEHFGVHILRADEAAVARVFAGRGDKIVPPTESEAMAKGIPGAKLVWCEQSGHVPMLEEPDLVARELAALAR